MNQPEYPTHAYVDDEIDLMELVANLWEGRWLIAGVTALSVALGSAYTWITPNSFTATYPINQVDTATASQYDAINLYARENDQILSIDADRLHDLAIEKIETRDPLTSAAATVLSKQDDLLAGSEEFQTAVTQLAYSIELLPPEEEEQSWFLQWFGTDEEFARRFLALSIDNTNQLVKDSLQELFTTRLALLETQRENRLEDLDTEIEEAVATYEMRRDRRIAYLREQAAIARQLGIAKNTIEAQTFAAANGVLTSVNTDSPFYLRGYEAIEEELNLITSRTDPTPFVSGLVELIQERRAIQNDRTIERAREAFALTPIASDDFTAIHTDVNLLEIERDNRPALILALAAILGGMIGMFVVLIRKGLQNYRARQQTA